MKPLPTGGRLVLARSATARQCQDNVDIGWIANTQAQSYVPILVSKIGTSALKSLESMEIQRNQSTENTGWRSPLPKSFSPSFADFTEQDLKETKKCTVFRRDLLPVPTFNSLRSISVTFVS
jgi:hypothetical protein